MKDGLLVDFLHPTPTYHAQGKGICIKIVYEYLMYSLYLEKRLGV